MSGVSQHSVGADADGQRLDRWFRQHFPGVPHGRLEKLLRTGQIRVDGHRAKGNTRLEAGQQIRVPPLDATAPPKARAPDPRGVKELADAIVHMDEHVIVIDKPAGLAVQGGSGVGRSVDALLDGLTFEKKERPKLVHRLDQDTSGLLVLARTSVAARKLTQAFRERDTEKLYWAIVVGVPPAKQGKFDQRLAKTGGAGSERMRAADDGKSAVTLYRMLDSAARQASFLELRPVTGRTHQLRAHCAEAGCPILGDGKYGGRAAFLDSVADARKLHLHARALRIPHPGGGMLELEAPPSSHILETMRRLGFDPAGAR
ncbi:MAG: RluA family pseudouridine synthase [Alphaproteobacteria bacterium]